MCLTELHSLLSDLQTVISRAASAAVSLQEILLRRLLLIFLSLSADVPELLIPEHL